jgi:hypothetical protein
MECNITYSSFSTVQLKSDTGHNYDLQVSFIEGKGLLYTLLLLVIYFMMLLVAQTRNTSSKIRVSE